MRGVWEAAGGPQQSVQAQEDPHWRQTPPVSSLSQVLHCCLVVVVPTSLHFYYSTGRRNSIILRTTVLVNKLPRFLPEFFFLILFNILSVLIILFSQEIYTKI